MIAVKINKNYFFTFLITIQNNLLSNIIRNDWSFIFKASCSLNWLYWQKQKRVDYKNLKFPNYNYLVLYLIRKYKADRCKIIYLDYDDDKLCRKKTKVKGKNRYWGN